MKRRRSETIIFSKMRMIRFVFLGLLLVQHRASAFTFGNLGSFQALMTQHHKLWNPEKVKGKVSFVPPGSIRKQDLWKMSAIEDKENTMDVGCLTVEQLKQELRKHGLRVSGKKADLVQRLLDAGGPLSSDPKREQVDAEVLGVGSAEDFRAENQEKKKERQTAYSGTWKSYDDIGGLPEKLNGTNPVMDDLMIREEVKVKSKDGIEFDAYTVQARAALQPWTVTKGLQKLGENDEVKTILLLPDIYGWNTEFSRSVADNISAVCDAVVMVPDLFRGNAWNRDVAIKSEEYEEWRASHQPSRVVEDIRAAAQYVQHEFNGTSLGLVGFCYGGGRAIEEAAAGVINPDALAVFYPARYDANELSKLTCPTVGIFASEDHIAGATKEDAIQMHRILSDNAKVQDFVVRIFQGEGHGFAHVPGAKKEQQNAEDAILLATAWLDIYLRVKQRTTGPAAKSQKALWDE